MLRRKCYFRLREQPSSANLKVSLAEGERVLLFIVGASDEDAGGRPLRLAGEEPASALRACCRRANLDIAHAVPLWRPASLGALPGARMRQASVAILYGGTFFACRRCHELAYESQRERNFERALRSAQAIQERLGGNGCVEDWFPQKRCPTVGIADSSAPRVTTCCRRMS